MKKGTQVIQRANDCFDVKGPRGGRVSTFDYLYAGGVIDPDYPLPALPIKIQPMKHGIGLIERHRDGWVWAIVGEQRTKVR